MKQVRGVTIEMVEVEGEQNPSIIFWESRTKQILALLSCPFIIVGGIFMWADAHNPLLIRLCGILAVLFFPVLGVMKLQQLRSPLGCLALTPAGIFASSPARAYLIPWEQIKKFLALAQKPKKLLVLPLVRQ